MAAKSFTGMVTRPNVIEPVQIACAIALVAMRSPCRAGRVARATRRLGRTPRARSTEQLARGSGAESGTEAVDRAPVHRVGRVERGEDDDPRDVVRRHLRGEAADGG